MTQCYRNVTISTAFYFGFINQTYMYNEKQDDGVQTIPFSAAPGNKTENTISFLLNLSPISAEFKFGSMLQLP